MPGINSFAVHKDKKVNICIASGEAKISAGIFNNLNLNHRDEHIGMSKTAFFKKNKNNLKMLLCFKILNGSRQ